MALSTSSSALGLPRNPLEKFWKTSEMGLTTDLGQLLGTEAGGLCFLLSLHTLSTQERICSSSLPCPLLGIPAGVCPGHPSVCGGLRFCLAVFCQLYLSCWVPDSVSS